MMWGENLLRGGILGLFALGVISSGVRAQMSVHPPEIEQKVIEIGRVLTPQTVAATAALFAPFQERPPYAGIHVHRDLKYGADPQNRLDIFVPDPLPSEARPVLLFMHGGSFAGGMKPGSPYYDNVGIWAARHGLIGININYRSASKNPWPAAIEDIGAAVHWTIQSVAPFNGDPDKIFIMGHSEGATHVAGYIAHPDLQPPGGAGVIGAILLSGVYDLADGPLSDSDRFYFGDDPQLYEERSAVSGLIHSKLPLFVVAAEFDPQGVEKQADLLKKDACAEHLCPRFLVLPKHSHMSEVYSINTGDTELTNAILSFIKAN